MGKFWEGETVTEGMLIGVQTPTQRPWPELAAQWTWLEDLGFDSLWLADHYVPPFKLDGPIFEPWTLLAGLALATQRVRLGVLVSCNTFRHPPLVAKEAVTVDHISGGRLEFGLGAGLVRPRARDVRHPLPGNAELVGRFRRRSRSATPLFTQDVTTYDGTVLPGAGGAVPARRRCSSRASRSPSAAHGPRMMRIVARYADRWNSNGSVAEMAERNRLLDEACADVGRDPSEILRSHLYVPAIHTDEHPWDSPEALRDFTGRLREAGIREAIIQIPAQIAPDQVERIAETAAELRAAARA